MGQYLGFDSPNVDTRLWTDILDLSRIVDARYTNQLTAGGVIGRLMMAIIIDALDTINMLMMMAIFSDVMDIIHMSMAVFINHVHRCIINILVLVIILYLLSVINMSIIFNYQPRHGYHQLADRTY